MSNTYSAGVATAYGAAVRGGYTGTYAEWCAAMADFGDKSQQAIVAAEQAAQSAADAANSATDAADSASSAETFKGNAEDSAATAHNSEANAADSASAAAQSATGAADSASAAAGSATNAAASAAAAQAVKDSIPADYTELSNDVSDLKSAVSYIGDFATKTVTETYRVQFATVSGHKYTITNLSGANVSVYLRVNATGNVQTVSSGLAVGASVTFTSNQDTNYIAGYCGSETVLEIVDLTSKTINWDKYADDIALLSAGKYPVRMISGGFVSSDGTISVNQYYVYTDYIDCSSSDSVRIIAPVDKLQYCCWYSADKQTVKAFQAQAGDNTIPVPDGYTFCRLSAPTARMAGVTVYTIPYTWIKAVDDKTVVNKKAISALQNGYMANNVVPFVAWKQGSINADDKETASSYYIHTDYEFVGNLTGLSFVIADGYYMMWHTYGIDKTLIGKYRTWAENTVIPIEDNVAYIRLIIAGDQNQVAPADASTLISLFGFNKSVPSIPEYWETQLTTKISDIRDLQKTCGSRGDEFIYITDYHDSTNGTYNANVSVNLIRRIMQDTSMRMVIFGGDGFDHSSTLSAYRDGQYNFYKKFDFLKAGQFFPVIGNHEFYSNLNGADADAMTSGEAYNINLRRFEGNFVATDYYKSYCFDNQAQKIRYFVVGCNYDSVATNDQVAWFLGQLLLVPDGYSVFLFTHSGTYIVDGDTEHPAMNAYYQKMLDGLDALKSGASVEIDGVTYDFTGKSRDVICALSGHTHVAMSTVTTGGIPVVVRAADKINANRTKGTDDEQCFDAVNIDLTNRKIYFTNIGAGSDADFSF